MNIELERKAFDDWHFEHWKLNCAYSESIEDAKILYDRVYSHTHAAGERERGFMSWQASANREGYKLVPMEMSWQKADELASKEWDKNKSMFCVDNRDMSALQVEEVCLRWCKNKAYQIMSDYKAMIGACDDH